MRKELEKLKKAELINEIIRLQEELKNVENNKKTDSELQEENMYLSREVRELRKEVEQLGNERFELTTKLEIMKYKQSRNAGRKKKCDDKQIAEILEARKENKSMRVIAKEFGVSLGLVQKIISEHKEEN